MKTIWNHIINWLEFYLWVPVSLSLIWLSVSFHYAMTGRPTGEDPYEWIVGFAPQFVKAILAIVLVSISKEAFGSWLNKQEKLSNPMYASVSIVCSTAIFIALLFAFSH